jgi:hypothetical protein
VCGCPAAYLAKLLVNRTFADNLDVKNEHLDRGATSSSSRPGAIPFSNGVLDLDRL